MAEVMPIVDSTGVPASVCGANPFCIIPKLLEGVKVWASAFCEVQNFPTVGTINGTFRASLGEIGMLASTHLRSPWLEERSLSLAVGPPLPILPGVPISLTCDSPISILSLFFYHFIQFQLLLDFYSLFSLVFPCGFLVNSSLSLRFTSIFFYIVKTISALADD